MVRKAFISEVKKYQSSMYKIVKNLIILHSEPFNPSIELLNQVYEMFTVKFHLPKDNEESVVSFLKKKFERLLQHGSKELEFFRRFNFKKI